MMLAGSAALLLSLAAADPRVLDPRYELELVLSEPEIVTPVGLAFDDRGRLLVIESHTHFRPEGYTGPPADRIRLVGQDGKALRTYYEGTKYTMGLRAGADGWMYVATRMEVFRLKDADGDGAAETREEVAHLETKGNYPHNGLSGLAVGPDGKLYFGMGENLGEPYELIGKDGKRLPGGGEGGNVFRCDLDGSKLERIATGFWNPFGLCFDPFGRLFAVDNDPDASPPCRLLHVVPGGDYGFQFRYGRAGKHPLQAWDGELPGTLPMAGGTGEAPCAVVPHEGALWVTSWGHHRIERFAMRPKGATVVGTSEIVVQGDENFRPVDLAAAPNGDLYFTDWVDKSYPLHGKGRLWRLRKQPDAADPAASFPPLSEGERRAATARESLDLDALRSADPFLHAAAVWGLVANDESMSQLRSRSRDGGDRGLVPRDRLGLLEAERWRNELSGDQRDGLLKDSLRTPDVPGGSIGDDVRLFALRWAADEKIAALAERAEALLDHPDVSPRLFRTVIAALDRLRRGEPNKKEDPLKPVFEVLADERRSPAVRAVALSLLPANAPTLTPRMLTELAESGKPPLDREAVRTIAVRGGGEFFGLLSGIANDSERPAELRADAVLGLAADPAKNANALAALAASDVAAVAWEARRAISERVPEGSAISSNDPMSWTGLVEDSAGDSAAGWRVFFRASGAACSRCHTLAGRGTPVGPDLTGIGRRMDRWRLLESILRPSSEVAPQYVPWTLVMTDGRVLVGLPIEVRDTPEGTEQFVGADGKRFTLMSSEIAERHASEMSLMPAGLEKLMTDEEVRDLLALLSSE